MSHRPFIREIEAWLVQETLGDPDITLLFESLCERLHAVGIPVERAALSWPTLHPLFHAEQVFWWLDRGAKLERYYHSSAGSEAWLKSPFYYVINRGLPRLRRHLAGENALLDFEVLEDFRDQGYTDYLLTAAYFRIAELDRFGDARTGIMASWATKRRSGFSDEDLEALSRIQQVFAVACHAAIEKRVMRNVACAYLGETAARRVLSGNIRRGEGEYIDAVVWFSDMRDSTALSDRMAPDDYLRLLNCYFDCTAAQVIAEGGEVLNYIGDGVMAIFPVDGDRTGAARRATEAARRALAARAEMVEGQAGGDMPLAFGIGMTTGRVMFGNIGVSDRLAFSAIGRAVNAAQRLEAATKERGCPVLATSEIAESAPELWRRAGRVCLRDFATDAEVFTLREAESPGLVRAAE